MYNVVTPNSDLTTYPSETVTSVTSVTIWQPTAGGIQGVACMKVCYFLKSGIEYAKTQGKSYRKDGHVYKEGVKYLGKVVDKEKNIYWNSESGYYCYNPSTDEITDAPDDFVPAPNEDKRCREKVYLDFGDSYFLNDLLGKMGYRQVLDSIAFKNRDTLYAMIHYYVLENRANDSASIWFKGNYANVLYPKANLQSQRVSDFLHSIGSVENIHNFFNAHIDWVKKNVCNDPAVILDSTGLPNAINFRLAAISNHNGKISNECRLIVPVQRDSGFPLMFRAIKGNVVDLSTANRTLCELIENGMNVDMVLLDAGYPTKLNIEEWTSADIDFISRLPAKFNLYNKVVTDNLDTLKEKSNIVKYGDRVLYVKRCEGKLGETEVFCYLGCDVNRYNDEIHKLLKKIAKGKSKIDDLDDALESAGLFVLVSSLPYEADGILPAYYTRQAVEQYFDLSKGSCKLTPLRVHSEEALYGHFLLSTIAATINLYILKKLDRVYDTNDALFLSLRNQKCAKFKTRISLEEPDADANEFYKKFKIDLPLYFNISSGKPVPVDHITRRVVDYE